MGEKKSPNKKLEKNLEKNQQQPSTVSRSNSSSGLHPQIIADLKSTGLVDEQELWAASATSLPPAQWSQFLRLVHEHYLRLEQDGQKHLHDFEKLKTAVDNTPCTISWINSSLVYEGVNRALQDLGGIAEEVFVGKKIGFNTNENFFKDFAVQLFRTSEKTVGDELSSTIQGVEKKFWVVGSKYAQDTKAVVIGIDITELRQMEQQLEMSQKLVEIDDLTGLFNMRSMFNRIEREILLGVRYKRRLACIMMDLDHFKRVNDDHDHLFGSYVISEMGGIIRKNIRNIDLGARFGGDEFLIVLTDSSVEGVINFCERLRQVICRNHFEKGTDQMYLTPSIGYALTSPGSSHVTAESLVRAADEALYHAKESGRNCVRGNIQEEKPHLFEEK